MPNTAYIRLFYQACEEVLETGVWYVQTTGGLVIDPITHRDLAREVRDAAAGGWTAFAAKGTTFWGASVEVPKQEGSDNGPFRFMANACFKSVALVDPMPDAVTQRVTLEGTNTSGDPVRGGVRLCCIPSAGVDCNTLTAGQLTALQTFFDLVFPAIWSLSGGENFTRVVKSTHEFETTEFVPAPDRVVHARVVTRQDRVLNKAQCLPDQVVIP